MTGPRVLVIDDDPALREVVGLVLADDGCEVRAGKGDREALRLLEQWHPDVLLLDLRLPDGEGEELLRSCRRRATGETPILVLSASPTPERHADRLRVDGILPIPFDIDDLSRIVYRLTAVVSPEAKSGPS